MNRALVIVSLLAVLALAVSGCSSDERTASGAQRIEVSASGAFSPNPVVVKSGTPAELVLGTGSGCTAGLAMPTLGVALTDLTQGGATIQLPALQPGRHPLVCQSNMVMGELVVE